MDQLVINLALGFLSTMLGVFLRSMWQALRDLQMADKKLIDKVNSIEVLVAGGYVQKSEFNTRMDALFDKLDRIEDKLSGKEDKK